MGRRQQAEKDVGRNSQDALVLQYVYRLLTEVRPQTRDRLKREIFFLLGARVAVSDG